MTPKQTATFGEVLQRHRLAAGFSQEALAERAQISAAAVAALERGRRTNPRPETVALLATALQLTATDRAALLAAAMARDPGTAHPLPQAADTAPAPAEPPTPLPAPPTGLIGREHEAATVATLLCRPGSSRLVTLVGPGGVGKTRLALAVAQDLQDLYAGGAVFSDLSALRDPDLVAPTVAEALGLREAGAQSARDLLLTHLRDKQILLVLDNFEQVVAAAPLVADLVSAATGIAVLVTSRTALRVRAEQRYWVPALATPAPNETPVPEIAGYAALRLFATRAQAVQPGFAIDAGNAGTVAEICWRLDGVPLAIELAAARVSLLSPAALLARLEQQLRVLKGGARDLPERQQAIRATIDWSYGLLSAWEQVLLRRLSVFVGGFSLEAAEAVTAPGGPAEGDVLAGVDALMNHSMLRNVGQQESEPRFRMLETVREYGLEQLAANDEEAAVRRLHTAYYLALAETAKSRLFDAEQMRWLDVLEREHDNFRDILARDHGGPDDDQRLRLAGALWRFWYIRCHLGEARRWLQGLLALPARRSAPAALQAEVLLGLSVIAYAQTDYDQAAIAAEACAGLTRALGDGQALAVSLNILGGVARYRSDFARAAALAEECVALTRSSGDRWALALSLNNLAEAVRFQGAYERASALADESLALSRELGDRWGSAEALLTKARIACDLGDNGAALALHEESLAIVRELGHTRDIAFALAGIGHVARMQGDYTRAAALFEESAALLRPLGDKVRLAHILTGLGRVRHALKEEARAAALHRESLAIFRAVGSALGLAESLEGLAGVVGQSASLAGPAAQFLATADRLRSAIGAPLPPAEHAGYACTLAELRATLGDAAFAEAWAAGTTLPLERAIDDALACLDNAVGVRDDADEGQVVPRHSMRR